jgi:alkyl sulfatase BDS1-like metallo-beta-lactamase superfamily hydrolase
MLVFADPANAEGRNLLAQSYEQQGYQAESAIWRNQFLMAASELRGGVKPGVATQSLDMISAIPTGLLLDSVATRLNPKGIGERTLKLNISITDRQETARISIGNAVMVPEMGMSHATPDATLSGPRILFLGLLFQKTPLPMLEAAGLKIEGDKAALATFLAAIDPIASGFNVVEP